MGGTWQSSLSPPLPLLFLLLLLLLFPRMSQQAQHQQEDLTCLNDYLGNISCVWNCSNTSEKVKDQCFLWANIVNRRFKGKENFSCELMSLGQDHCYKGCHLQFNNKRYSVTHKASLDVKCKGKVVESSSYLFYKNIKLRPPGIPSITRGNLSWKAEKPNTILNIIYERQFKREDEPWEVARVRDNTQTEETLGPLLHLGVSYQARVRVRPPTEEKNSYNGTWSDWGPVLTWTSDVGDPPPAPPLQHLPLPVKKISLLCGGLCLVVAMTLCCNKKVRTLCCCDRFKMKSQHIPDPSRYFQPLHTVHGGDFQKWLSPMFGPESFASTQPPDSISPVEVAPMLYTEPYLAPGTYTPLPGKSVEAWTGSGQSSCYSNMGYFYTESQPGHRHIESCPIYFTYPLEAGGNVPKADTSGTSGTSRTSGTSYERLEQIQQFHFAAAPDLHNPQGEPLSPDSGFGVEVSEGGGMNEEEEEEDEWKRQKEEHSFAARLQSLGIPIPTEAPLSSPLRPPELMSTIMECEDTAPVTACIYTPSPPEASLARSASMIMQPCGSGYLTVKEMLNTCSNKSI